MSLIQYPQNMLITRIIVWIVDYSSRPCPPVRDTLMAVNENDIDDHFDYDDFTESSQHDNSFNEAEPNVRGVTNNPDAEFSRVSGDSPDRGDADSIADNDNLTIHPADEFIQVIRNNLTLHPAEEIFKGAGKPLNTLVPTGISKITELTLDQFDNNYKLFAKKTSWCWHWSSY